MRRSDNWTLGVPPLFFLFPNLSLLLFNLGQMMTVPRIQMRAGRSFTVGDKTVPMFCDFGLNEL
jgi:hypothetical protein